MTVKRFVKETDAEEWNAFLLQAKNSSFLFYRNFMDYHSDRFEDHSLMIYDEKKLIALLPANINEGRLISHKGLTYGGIIMAVNIKLPQVIGIMYHVLFYLHDQGIFSFTLKLIPSFFTRYVTDDLEYVMFLLDAQLFRRDAAVVIDYSEKIPYSGNIRREAIAAEKKGAFIKYDDELSGFWKDVLIPNLHEKFGLKPVHTLEEICLLKERFPENVVQINAYIDNEVAAGTTLFIDNKIVHCQYISSTEKGRKTGCLNYLFKTIINDYSVKYSYFDFGIVNEKEGRHFNKGLLFWKEGFGGRTRKHDFYDINTVGFKMLEKYI